MWQELGETMLITTGWTTDRETLALALYRLGYMDTAGGLTDQSGVSGHGTIGTARGLAETVVFHHMTVPEWLLDDPDPDTASFSELQDQFGDSTDGVAVTVIDLTGP